MVMGSEDWISNPRLHQSETGLQGGANLWVDAQKSCRRYFKPVRRDALQS